MGVNPEKVNVFVAILSFNEKTVDSTSKTLKDLTVMDTLLIRAEAVFIAVRSGGPGGQNVNKVSSAAVLYWDFNKSSLITENQKELVRKKLESHINKEGKLYIKSEEFRDLERNKNRCLEKVQKMLSEAFRESKKRKATKPSYSSKLKKRESKTRRAETKRLRQKL